MIKDLFLLKDLSEQEKNEIISLFPNPTEFKKGEIIYSADTFKNALGYIIKGKTSALSDGFFKKSFTAGSVFGAAAVFGNDKTYISQIVAETDTKVLFIDESTLRNIFSLYPKTTLNYISFLSEKVRFLNQKLNMISCPNAEDTVYKYLTQNMNGENVVNLPVNMTVLAKMLGLGRASLYRSLDSLESGGKIIRKKNIIKVI